MVPKGYHPSPKEWRRSKPACLIIPTLHYKLNHLLPIQCILMPDDPYCRVPPVDRIKPQVRRQVVCKLILALSCSVQVQRVSMPETQG